MLKAKIGICQRCKKKGKVYPLSKKLSSDEWLYCEECKKTILGMIKDLNYKIGERQITIPITKTKIGKKVLKFLIKNEGKAYDYIELAKHLKLKENIVLNCLRALKLEGTGVRYSPPVFLNKRGKWYYRGD